MFFFFSFRLKLNSYSIIFSLCTGSRASIIWENHRGKKFKSSSNLLFNSMPTVEHNTQNLHNKSQNYSLSQQSKRTHIEIKTKISIFQLKSKLQQFQKIIQTLKEKWIKKEEIKRKPRLWAYEATWFCRHYRGPKTRSWPLSATSLAMREPHRTNRTRTWSQIEIPQNQRGREIVLVLGVIF